MQHDIEFLRRRVAMTISAIYQPDELANPACEIEVTDNGLIVRPRAPPGLSPLQTSFRIEMLSGNSYRIVDYEIFDMAIAACADDDDGNVNFDKVTRILCALVESADVDVRVDEVKDLVVFTSDYVDGKELPVVAAHYVRALKQALR